MNETSEPNRKPIATSVAAGVVLVASFMPWGESRGAPTTPFGGSMFGGMQMSLTMTGWNGNANLAGLKLPNWLVVIAAAGAAGAA